VVENTFISVNGLIDFMGKKITISPNTQGSLFTIRIKYKIDGVLYDSPLTDSKIIDLIILSNKKKLVENRHDIYIISHQSIFMDFTIDECQNLFSVPISIPLYHKLLGKLLNGTCDYREYSMSFVVSNNLEESAIGFVKDFVVNNIEYGNNDPVLISLLISCRDHIVGSSQMIADMRSSIIKSIIG
jgi:hypothetical protein